MTITRERPQLLLSLFILIVFSLTMLSMVSYISAFPYHKLVISGTVGKLKLLGIGGFTIFFLGGWGKVLELAFPEG